MMQELLVILFALAAAGTVAATTYQVVSAARPGQALALYQNPAPQKKEPDLNTMLGLPTTGLGRQLPWLAGGGLGLVALIAGLPLIVALGAGALAHILASEYLKNKVLQARLVVERELPTFVSRLGGMLLVKSAARLAVEETAVTLTPGPLRSWLERLLANWAVSGDVYLDQAHVEASRISPLLGLVVYQLRRLAEAGGAGFSRAFATVAEELSAILEARAVAASKAEAARRAVLTMLAVMAGVLALLLTNPAVRRGFADPTTQIISLVALAAMAFGYGYMNDMITEAMEG